MLPARVPQWAGYIPAVFLALFCGRLLSEQFTPGLPGALAITLLVTLIALFLLHRLPIRLTWPLALLALYVVASEPDPRTALLVGFLTAVTFLLNLLQKQITNWSLVERFGKSLYSGKWKNRQYPVTTRFGRSQLSERQVQVGIVILLTIGFLILYVNTLSPDILPADNGEFQLIVAELGVAHPPGFPLYTVLAHLMTWLPFNASPAYKVNLLSAFTSTAALILVYLSVYRLTGKMIAGLAAVLALGTATTFWAQAATANIRSLTALFSAAALYALIILWQRQQVAGDGTPPQPRKSALIPFILILSFGLTHHASLLFMGLVFIAFILLLNHKLLTTPRYWPRYFLAALAGLLPLLYLIWRGAVEARGAPADLTTLSGFLNHVLALGFRGDFFYFTEPALLLERLRIMVNVLTFQFHPLLLIGSAVGLITLALRQWKLAFLLGGAFFIHTLVTATYRAPQTVEYMLPAYVPLVICLGYAAGALKPAFRPLAAAILLTAVLVQTLDRLPGFQTLHLESDTRDYVQPLLEQAPDNAVILADWHWATPLWYIQSIEGLRPDVDVQFVFPTAEAYAETWARRIRELYEDGRPVLATHYDEAAYADLPIAEPVGEAFLYSPEPRQTLPPDFQPLDLRLGSAVHIQGYHLVNNTVEIGQAAVLTLAWLPLGDSAVQNLSLFAHLVDSDGRLYAQHDQAVQGREDGLTLTQFLLPPAVGAAPGEFSIMIGAYNPGPLLDGEGQSRTVIETLLVQAMRQRPFTDNPVYRTVPSGRPLLRLVGYDWDHTLDTPRLYLHWQTEQGYQTEVRDGVTPADLNLPDWFGPWGLLRENEIPDDNPNKQYVPFGQGIVWRSMTTADFPQSVAPGQQLTLRQHFFSSRPVMRDLVVSLRLVGYEPDGFHWAWWDLHDSVPALGAIPTLKWMPGSAVIDPHQVKVDPDAPQGQQIGALLRIYDAFNGRPLPILDNRIGQEAPWVPAGKGIVQVK